MFQICKMLGWTHRCLLWCPEYALVVCLPGIPEPLVFEQIIALLPGLLRLSLALGLKDGLQLDAGEEVPSYVVQAVGIIGQRGETWEVDARVIGQALDVADLKKWMRAPASRSSVEIIFTYLSEDFKRMQGFPQESYFFSDCMNSHDTELSTNEIFIV